MTRRLEYYMHIHMQNNAFETESILFVWWEAYLNYMHLRNLAPRQPFWNSTCNFCELKASNEWGYLQRRTLTPKLLGLFMMCEIRISSQTRNSKLRIKFVNLKFPIQIQRQAYSDSEARFQVEQVWSQNLKFLKTLKNLKFEFRQWQIQPNPKSDLRHNSISWM